MVAKKAPAKRQKTYKNPNGVPRDGGVAFAQGWPREAYVQVGGREWRFKKSWTKAWDNANQQAYLAHVNDNSINEALGNAPATHRITHDEVWVTKNGQKIEVQDLEISHAQSIIRMIVRRNRQRLLVKLMSDDLFNFDIPFNLNGQDNMP